MLGCFQMSLLDSNLCACFLATCYFTWNRCSVIAYAVDSSVHFAICDLRDASKNNLRRLLSYNNKKHTEPFRSQSKRWVDVHTYTIFYEMLCDVFPMWVSITHLESEFVDYGVFFFRVYICTNKQANMRTSVNVYIFICECVCVCIHFNP